MNKYEARSGVSKDEQAANRELNQVFHQVKEIVLNNKNYTLGAARELMANLSETEAKKVYELFNFQEGALPDELAVEYIKLVYSPSSIEKKMTEGKTFYESLSAIAWEIKNAHLELNPELVQAQIDLSSKSLKQI